MEDFILSKHAKEQLEVRRINETLVWKIIENPQQELREGLEKKVYQSIIADEKGEEQLIRVFVNVAKHPKLIITVYKTSKIQKYWKDESKI